MSHDDHTKQAAPTAVAGVADWETAPGFLEGAMTAEVDPRECGIAYWLEHVAQGPLVGLTRGHRADAEVPKLLLEPGPLRDSLIQEYAFRTLAEDVATRICARIVAAADDIVGLEFYTTQTLDEARHGQIFRDHLLDLGVPLDELKETIDANAGRDFNRFLEPMWSWGLPAAEDKFINGVAIVTILLEGVLAPTTELSDRKWAGISPATAQVERGACVDEIRHLAAGSWFIRQHLIEHPEDRQSLVELLEQGRQVWAELPMEEMLVNREMLYQQGIEQHRDEIGDYEIFPGRRLIETTVEERLMAALKWSQDIQAQRLRYMGLPEAIPGEAGF
jgi:hypothetical protein